MFILDHQKKIINLNLKKILKYMIPKINRLFLLVTIVINTTSCSLKDNITNSLWVGEKYAGFANYQSVEANKYLVSSSEQLASNAGKKILEKGGNAIDASIAVQMMLNVVEPHASGIGGGLFLIYFDKKTRKTIYFNGRETAPSKAFPEMFLDENKQPKKFSEAVQGGLSVGVPGVLKTLYLAHQKYGKLPWAQLFEEAINIANQGFPITLRMYNALKELDYLKNFAGMKNYYDEHGKLKKVGEIITNKELSKTLAIIAKSPTKAFYEGQIAKNIVKEVNNSKVNQGLLSLADLKNYQPKTGKLICQFYREKYKICTMPLPSGGVSTLQIIGILNNFSLANYLPNSPDAIHIIAEAIKLAYADRKEYLGDVNEKIIDKLLAKDYLAKRAKLIDFTRANNNFSAGNLTLKKLANQEILEKPSTTHFSIIDSQGNAVALTSSIEYFFGSGLVVDGFVLNNQLTDFALNPYRNSKLVANAIAPNKQPLSSMSPTFVFDKNDNLLIALGSPGGPRISQFIVKTLVAMLDWNLDIQRAISLPNFAVIANRLELEDRTELVKLKKQLEKLNHQVVITDITSGINAVEIQGNSLLGGADPRRNGYVAGH